jgi:acyl-coenzyme A thioesterase PaaI-like protein
MMDEIASWLVFVKLGTAGVTYRMKTRYRRPVHISRGPITLRATMVQQQRNIATIEVTLLNGDGIQCSEGLVDYFLMPPGKAEKEMHYPGKEAFYP